MEITWYGSTCFRFAKRGLATVVTDPHVAAARQNFSAEIVTYHTLPEQIPQVAGDPYAITGPGEYEVGGVFITGIPSGSGAARRTHYIYQFHPLLVADMSSLEQNPSQSEVEVIGSVNVLIISAGGAPGWSAGQAAEVISRLEPNFVIPIYNSDDALQKFLKEMGVTDPPYQPMLKIMETSLPENTQVILLENAAGSRSTP